MAYYDLEEQEQLDALKGWWRQWGIACVIGLGLALAAVAAYMAWGWYKDNQAIKASELYQSLHKSIRAGETKQAQETAATLTQQYKSTGYAALAALMVARLNFDKADIAAAKQNLQWVIDNSRDEDFKSVARFRLAGLLLDEKQFDPALKLLDVKPDHPMASLYADLRGDVLVAKGATAEARAAYQTAYEKTDARSPYRNLIQLKIDSLGESKS